MVSPFQQIKIILLVYLKVKKVKELFFMNLFIFSNNTFRLHRSKDEEYCRKINIIAFRNINYGILKYRGSNENNKISSQRANVYTINST